MTGEVESVTAPQVEEVVVAPATPWPAGTWFVSSGEATLFLAERHLDGSLGRRTHVATLLAPGLLVLADAPAGSAWVVADGRGTLDELPGDVDIHEAADRTITALCGVIRATSPLHGGRVIPLEASATDLVADSDAVTTARGWFHSTAGAVELSGAALPAAGAPLDQQMRLSASSPTSVRMQPIAAVDQTTLLEGLRWLTLVAAEAAGAAHRHDESAAMQRARAAQATNDAVERGAIELLSKEILGAVEARPPSASDPLVAVAGIVGAAAGFEVQGPSAGFQGREGTAAVRALASSSNLFVRAVSLDEDWQGSVAEPMVGFGVDGTPYALLAGRHRASIVAADGRSWRADDPTAPEVLSTAFVLSAVPTDEQVTERGLLRRALRGQRRAVGAILGWSFIIAAVSLTVPLASGVVFGEIIPAGDTTRLAWLLLALLTAAIGVLPVQIAATAAGTRLEAVFSFNLQRSVWGRVLRSPVSLVERLGPGDMTVRLAALEQGRDLLDQSLLAAIPVIIGSLLSIGVLFFYDPVLAWFAVGWGVIVLAISVVIALRVARAQRAVDVGTGEVNGFLFQVLGAIPKLHVAGAEARAFAAWADRFRAAVGQQLTTRSAQQALANGLLGTTSTLVLFVAVAVTDQIDNVGTFIAFQTTYALFLAGILAFTTALSVLITLRPAMDRATEMASDGEETGEHRADPGPLRGAVSLHNVVFRYQDDTPFVFQGLDLEIGAGEMVAIVGASGSGKSTLLRLLLGFEQPEQGSVLFDNQDLSSLDVAAVRRQLGVVLQDGQLMPGSVFQNLAGTATISEDEAWELAELVSLADDIRAMPLGLKTIITMNGGAFSGGQIQRLMIARALATRPRIMLLDEATSALDNVTQRIVSTNLAELGMTRIVVAHRLSTIVEADRIVVIDHGRVVETGTYASLMAAQGAFYSLAARQVV